VYDRGGLGKCKVGTPHSHERLEVGKGALVGGVWFVRIERVTSGWFVVCMGDEVEDRLVVAHDEANGQWELWGSMRCDELKDMFGGHEIGNLLWT
jgi:hypothetical protein